MEAALPISAAVKPAAPRAKPVEGAAPSISLPLRFVLTGLVALCTGIGWLVVEPDLLTTYHYSPHAVAVTHLFVLGWLGSVVMGATYQLVPVALETRLYSERLARWHFAFHLVGFAGMVWMFRAWNLKQVGHFGSVLALGVGLFVYNLARTLLRIRKWHVVAAGIASALLWFSLTVLAGLSIVAGKCTYDAEGLAAAGGVGPLLHGLHALGTFVQHFEPFSAMHAHAHLGVVGLFTILIVGVSYKLVPMFALSELQSRWRPRASLALLNVGLLGAFISVLVRSPWKLAFALIIGAGLGLFGWEIAAIVGARKRRQLDWGVKSFLTALAMLAPLAVLAAVLAWPSLPLNGFTGQLENLYGFLGLMGFVSFAILGMLHKIIPFLVWYHSYSPHVGRSRVPSLAELYSDRLQVMGCGFWLAGLLATSAGIMMQNTTVARIGTIALATTLALFAMNFGKMLSHLRHPKLQRLTVPAAQ